MTEQTGLESDPIVPYANLADLPAELQSAIENYRKRMGFLPNALKLYMHRPQILKCLIELNNTVMRDASSHLDDGLKRRIAAVCSALNHSPYCVAHNANTLKSAKEAAGEGWGYSDTDVANLLDPGYEPGDELEAACFAFARAATRDPSDVPQAVMDRMTAVLTPPQVVELACVVGFWKMYNSTHEALYVPIEDELLGDDGFNKDEFLGEASSTAGNRPKATADVEIYTKTNCSFCRRAKRVLEGKGVQFREVSVDDDAQALETMTRRSGGKRTVPQIFIGGEGIGGMDGLLNLARAGELDSRLGISP